VATVVLVGGNEAIFGANFHITKAPLRIHASGLDEGQWHLQVELHVVEGAVVGIHARQDAREGSLCNGPEA